MSKITYIFLLPLILLSDLGFGQEIVRELGDLARDSVRSEQTYNEGDLMSGITYRELQKYR